MANIYSLPIQSISTMSDLDLRSFIRMRRELRRELPPQKTKKEKAKAKKDAVKSPEEVLNIMTAMSATDAARMLEQLKARMK